MEDALLHNLIAENFYSRVHRIIFYPIAVSKDDDMVEYKELGVILDKEQFSTAFMEYLDIFEECGYDDYEDKVVFPITVELFDLKRIFMPKDELGSMIFNNADLWLDKFKNEAWIMFIIAYEMTISDFARYEDDECNIWLNG